MWAFGRPVVTQRSLCYEAARELTESLRDFRNLGCRIVFFQNMKWEVDVCVWTGIKRQVIQTDSVAAVS
jgi:hypothetical protein